MLYQRYVQWNKAVDFELKIAEMDKPALLYKYTSVNNIRYLLDVVAENNLYFSSPFDFNDPFDCRPVISVGTTRQQIVKSKKNLSVALRYGNDIDKQYSKDLASEVVKIKINRELWDNLFHEEIDKKGVCCFTTKKDNLLMWSHYADSHKGVCYEFDTQFLPGLVPIIYSSEYPIIRLYDKNSYRNAIFTKSKDWSYEEEWRMVAKWKGLFPINQNALKSIIIGCKASLEVQSEIETIIEKRYPEVKIFKAHMGERRFVLDIKEIKINIQKTV